VIPPEHLETGGTRITVSLGNLQYGQSRDIFLRYSERPSFAPKTGIDVIPENDEDEADKVEEVKMEDSGFLVVDERAEDMGSPTVTARLTYQHMTLETHEVTATRSLLEPTTSLSEAEAAYHISRAAIVSFISDLFPLNWEAEHEATPYSEAIWLRLRDELIPKIPAARFKDPANVSLLQDLHGAAPHGQISLALSSEAFFNRWGEHYLPSLAGAHARQVCNSFKDPGPLQYGADSTLFAACRDKLDQLFDTLPPPPPSNLSNPYAEQFAYLGYGAAAPAAPAAAVNMHSYHRSDNPCFAGFCAVTLADGRRVRVEKLRAGTVVATPRGARRVAAVLKTRVRQEAMVAVDGMVVTPWHPVRRGGANTWVFPRSVARGRVRYTGSIYSVLLQPDADPEAHAVLVGGVWGVTLGHGLVRGGDARAHRFLGDYGSVSLALADLGPAKDGVVVGDGVIRDRKAGGVCGFKKATGVSLGSVSTGTLG